MKLVVATLFFRFILLREQTSQGVVTKLPYMIWERAGFDDPLRQVGEDDHALHLQQNLAKDSVQSFKLEGAVSGDWRSPSTRKETKT